MKFTLISALICLTLISHVKADDAGRKVDLKVEVAVSAETGWPSRLIVTGYNPRTTAWLGISLYPYNCSDLITDGRHSVTEIKQGEVNQSIPIDPSFWDGSFELAIWGKKVNRKDCKVNNCYWCKKNGFHVDESLAYKSGLLTRLNGYK